MTTNFDPSDDFPHEEYGLLLQLTAPGTTRKFRDKTSINRMDLIMADDMCETRPSGIVLPKILRKKLLLSEQQKQIDEAEKAQEKLQEAIPVVQTDSIMNVDVSAVGHEDARGMIGTSYGDDVNNPNVAGMAMNKRKSLLEQMDEVERTPLMKRVAYNDTSGSTRQMRLSNSSPVIAPNIDNIVYEADNEVDNLEQYLPDGYVVPETYRSINPSHVFTTSDLEKKLAQANAALLTIQKQLVRGEELYYQETDAHGNMYKGWDNFIDTKSEHMGIPNYEIGSSNDPKEKRKMPENVNNTPIRRMHNDLRWFSSSSSLTDGVGRLGKTDRKRSRRSLTSSMSNSSTVSGRTSRVSSELKKETDINTLRLSPVSDKTPFVDINLGNSRSEPKQIDIKKPVKNEMKDEVIPIATKKTSSSKKPNREPSVQFPPPDNNRQKIKKEDPPTAEEEEREQQMRQKNAEKAKEEKNTENEMKFPKDAPSAEDLKKEETGNQALKKRRSDALSPENSEEDLDDEDNDSSPKKGRPRKRKK